MEERRDTSCLPQRESADSTGARTGPEGPDPVPEVMTRTGYVTGTCGVEVLECCNREADVALEPNQSSPGAGAALEWVWRSAGPHELTVLLSCFSPGSSCADPEQMRQLF